MPFITQHQRASLQPHGWWARAHPPGGAGHRSGHLRTATHAQCVGSPRHLCGRAPPRSRVATMSYNRRAASRATCAALLLLGLAAGSLAIDEGACIIGAPPKGQSMGHSKLCVPRLPPAIYRGRRVVAWVLPWTCAEGCAACFVMADHARGLLLGSLPIPITRGSQPSSPNLGGHLIAA